MEFFDICDEYGNPTGGTIERTEAHAQGVCHRTAHIWVVRTTGQPDEELSEQKFQEPKLQEHSETLHYQVLLQKRAANKDSFPGRFDTSSAGHIQAGDEPRESALRELHEELGIQATDAELSYAGKFHIRYEKEFHGKMFRDNEVAFVYVYEKPIDISTLTLQEEEVECVEWFDLEEVYQACKEHDRKFCVPIGGLEILREYLAV